MKILVDEMPRQPSDCVFARYDAILGGYFCAIKYSDWCILSQNIRCPYLKAGEQHEID